MIGSLLKTLALCLISGISVSQPKTFIQQPLNQNTVGNYYDVSSTYTTTSPSLITVPYNNEELTFYSMASISLEFEVSANHFFGVEVFNVDYLGLHYQSYPSYTYYVDPFDVVNIRGQQNPLIYLFSHVDDYDDVDEYLYFYALPNIRTLGPNGGPTYTSRFVIFYFESFDINDTYYLLKDPAYPSDYALRAELSLDESPYIICDYSQSIFFDGDTANGWKGFQTPKCYFEAQLAVGSGFTLHIYIGDLADGKGLIDSDYDTGYQDGLSDGKTIGYREGYTKGYSEGLGTTERGSFFNLFGALADTPLRMLYSLFSFDLFGMSALVIVLSFLTGIFVIKIVKKFL